jgi:hypothetical protein
MVGVDGIRSLPLTMAIRVFTGCDSRTTSIGFSSPNGFGGPWRRACGVACWCLSHGGSLNTSCQTQGKRRELTPGPLARGDTNQESKGPCIKWCTKCAAIRFEMGFCPRYCHYLKKKKSASSFTLLCSKNLSKFEQKYYKYCSWIEVKLKLNWS